MATIYKLRGRVVELGESQNDSVSEHKQGRRVQVHLRKQSFIVVEDEKGVRHELPGCMFVGQAALYELEVGGEVELLYGGPIPVSKKDQWGNNRATVIYATRLVNVTEWMGADAAHISGAMAWELWKGAALFFVLIPVLAVFTFFAGGAGGLYAAWHFVKAMRGALKLSTTDEVRDAIDQAKRELGAVPAPRFAQGELTKPADLLAN